KVGDGRVQSSQAGSGPAAGGVVPPLRRLGGDQAIQVPDGGLPEQLPFAGSGLGAVPDEQVLGLDVRAARLAQALAALLPGPPGGAQVPRGTDLGPETQPLYRPLQGGSGGLQGPHAPGASDQDGPAVGGESCAFDPCRTERCAEGLASSDVPEVAGLAGAVPD